MLKPSLRTRYRYVMFEVTGEDLQPNEITKLTYSAIVRLVGTLGASEMDVKVESKDDKYFIRVNRESLDLLRGIIPLIERLGHYNARPKIVKTSGTVKTLFSD